jgi:hypothetical protein
MPKDKVKIDVNKLHEILGHPSEETTKRTAKGMGIELTGEFKRCENCALSNIRKRKVTKESENKATNKGERLFLDISSVKYISGGGRRFWLLIVDEATSMKWSFFLRSKSELAKITMQHLEELMANGDEVKYIRMDNAGENMALKRNVKKNPKLAKIEFEITSPNTPQQNGKVERSFATLYSKVRSMMNHAGFTREKRNMFWAECARTATMLSNVTLSEGEETTAYEKFYGRKPRWIANLTTFGNMFIVKDNQKIKGKLEDRGTKCMFVGYPENHEARALRFINLKTGRALLSQDYKSL